jgi:hypothetical protein
VQSTGLNLQPFIDNGTVKESHPEDKQIDNQLPSIFDKNEFIIIVSYTLSIKHESIVMVRVSVIKVNACILMHISCFL